MNFNTAFDRVIGHEGGYVNDPNDPGGETNWGISKRAYPDIDIKSLTREQAKAIYLKDYWDRANADQYAYPIAFQLFDASVNSGIGNGIRFLQRAVGVAPDGYVGPITLAAINAADVSDVVARFNAERLEFMTYLSNWPSAGRGWARRIANNLRFSAADTP